MINHYTDITTLALILDSQNIRFSRLDKVDDVTETRHYGRYNLSNYLFVSCWTSNEYENIPQWKMYTNDMSGVMISLPQKMFKEKDIKLGIVNGVSIINTGKSYFELSELFPGRYMILPIFGGPSGYSNFFKEIDYVENEEELKKRYENIVNISKENGQISLQIKEINKLGRYKIKDWGFQKEVRFVLFILPAPDAAPTCSKDYGEVSQYGLQSILNNILPPISYFDLPLDETVIDNIIVTLGPKCDRSHELIVDALLKKYAKSGILKKSKFTGLIK